MKNKIERASDQVADYINLLAGIMLLFFMATFVVILIYVIIDGVLKSL